MTVTDGSVDAVMDDPLEATMDASLEATRDTSAEAAVDAGSKLPLGPPILSLGQAARAVGLSKSTVRRYVRTGRLPSAFRASSGTWLVPVTDLLAAGLELTAPGTRPQLSTKELRPLEALSGPPVGSTERALLADLHTEVDRLRTENAILRERFEAAQLLSVERQERIEDLRLALRMLPEVWSGRFQGMLAEARRHEESPGTARPLLTDVWNRHPGPGPGPLRGSSAEPSSPDLIGEVLRLRRELAEERAEIELLHTEVRRRRWWRFGRRRAGRWPPDPDNA